MRAAVTVLLAFAAMGSCVAYPWVHNYHIAPLARLAAQVQAGDSCGATAAAFSAYYERQKRRGNEDVQFADGSTAQSHEFSNRSPPRRFMHLYDLGIMDDLQLTVICDAAGDRVEEVFYLGD